MYTLVTTSRLLKEHTSRKTNLARDPLLRKNIQRKVECLGRQASRNHLLGQTMNWDHLGTRRDSHSRDQGMLRQD